MSFASLADILPKQIIQTKTILEWKNQLYQNAVKIIENNQWYQPSFEKFLTVSFLDNLIILNYHLLI
ncbi:hypothetical protein [Candidatus Phytoplasma tritici]|uniref:hypothetical protein n=1 Tax=Candidatus Phytoplasma tritici TaxID=321961 RepID=UPI00040A0904|nr:hypothetical protein [Candidatus Phytoplasma tritici]